MDVPTITPTPEQARVLNMTAEQATQPYDYAYNMKVLMSYTDAKSEQARLIIEHNIGPLNLFKLLIRYMNFMDKLITTEHYWMAFFTFAIPFYIIYSILMNAGILMLSNVYGNITGNAELANRGAGTVLFAQSLVFGVIIWAIFSFKAYVG